MFGGVCFPLGGNRIGGVPGDELIVKFDKAGHEKVDAQKRVRPSGFSGEPMPGIVYVGPDGLRKKT